VIAEAVMIQEKNNMAKNYNLKTIEKLKAYFNDKKSNSEKVTRDSPKPSASKNGKGRKG